MGVVMGVDSNFSPFITIRVKYITAQKIPEPLIFKAPGSLGEKIRTSGLLNPIQTENIKNQGFEPLVMGI